MPISQQIGSSSQIKPGVCTSTTRPASPYAGQKIYETDTKNELIWDGSAWSRPWNIPWGNVGYVSRTTGLTGIAGGATDLTGMSVTFTAVANRNYKATWHVNGYKAGVDLDGTQVLFTNAANTVLSYIIVRSPSGNWALNLSASHVFTTSAGSSTFKLRMASYSGTFSPTADSDNPCQLIIEDIGPA